MKSHQLFRLQCDHGISSPVVIAELNLVYAGSPALDDSANLTADQSFSRQVLKQSDYGMHLEICHHGALFPPMLQKQLVSRGASSPIRTIHVLRTLTVLVDGPDRSRPYSAGRTGLARLARLRRRGQRRAAPPGVRPNRLDRCQLMQKHVPCRNRSRSANNPVGGSLCAARAAK